MPSRMSGLTDLPTLLQSLRPKLVGPEYVFVVREQAAYGDASELDPIATIAEPEGLTLIIPRSNADSCGEAYDGVFRRMTLQVHSSLEAVGLTAVVATKLAERKISANVVAGFHHDHLFVPAARAHDAIEALRELTDQGERKR